VKWLAYLFQDLQKGLLALEFCQPAEDQVEDAGLRAGLQLQGKKKGAGQAAPFCSSQLLDE
jgi:hypothetical protein